MTTPLSKVKRPRKDVGTHAYRKVYRIVPVDKGGTLAVTIPASFAKELGINAAGYIRWELDPANRRLVLNKAPAGA